MIVARWMKPLEKAGLVRELRSNGYHNGYELTRLGEEQLRKSP